MVAKISRQKAEEKQDVWVVRVSPWKSSLQGETVTVDKPGRHYLTQAAKVNSASDTAERHGVPTPPLPADAP